MAKFGLKIDTSWDKQDVRETECGDKERLTESQAETRVHHMEKKYQKPFESYRCARCVKVDEDVCYHVGKSTKHDSLTDKYR
jgi:hypothetical protein